MSNRLHSFSRELSFNCPTTLSLLVVVFASTGVTQAWSQDNGNGSKPDTAFRRASPNVLCGVNALVAAARILDSNASVLDFCYNQEFVTPSVGSSLLQLSNAAREIGLHGVAIQNIDAEFLITTPYLIILHVKLRPEDEDFNHYVLFAGMNERTISLLDPPNPVYSMPFDDFAPRMSGKGLIISGNPIEPLDTVGGDSANYSLYTGSLLVILGLTIMVIYRVLPPGRWAKLKKPLRNIDV